MGIPKEVLEKIVYYRREVDRICSEFLGPSAGGAEVFGPAPADIYETSEAIVVDVELPGVPADAIAVSASGNVILIEAERTADDHARLMLPHYLHAERSTGPLRRLLEIPGAGDLSRAQAQLLRGVLRLTIPKVDDRRARWRRISIERDGSTGGP